MEKSETDIGKSQRKNVSFNSRLQAIEIICQRRAFWRQRIPEPFFAKKETVIKYILIIPRNSDRKIMQLIRTTIGTVLRIGNEPVHPVQMNI